MSRAAQHLLVPSLGLVLGGALWGAYWIPLRAIGETGPQLGWPGLLIYVCTAVLLLPVAVMRWRHIWANLWGIASCGLLTGMAFSFYGTSLFFTDVVRAILLFYLTPIWGTLLGIFVLGERLTIWRVLALLAGLAGLLTVFWDGGNVPLPRNLGDWLALASGLAWALGTLQLHRTPGIPVSEQVTAFVWGSLIVTLASIALSGGVLGPVPTIQDLTRSAPLVLATSIYVVPMLFLT
ncbi:MAG: DMT family transporter, partial [Pseudomonadota bacterium]